MNQTPTTEANAEVDELIRFTDRDGDTCTVEEQRGNCTGPTGKAVFIHSAGAYLDVDQVKALRKRLKQWLIEYGHKAAA